MKLFGAILRIVESNILIFNYIAITLLAIRNT